MKSRVKLLLLLSAGILVSCTLLACGADVELRPELESHLDAYESLIDTYEPKFAEVRGDPPEFKKVADAYSPQVKAWISQIDTIAPDLTDEEGKALRSRINKLNRRAERMLRGG